MTTLQEAIKTIERYHQSSHRHQSKKTVPRKGSIADELLGKYAGILPKGKTSTQYLRELRETLYGKIK